MIDILLYLWKKKFKKKKLEVEFDENKNRLDQRGSLKAETVYPYAQMTSLFFCAQNALLKH